MTAPLRIALVVHSFNMGGLERYVSHLLNRLDRNRFAPSLVCMDRNGTAQDWVRVDDVPVFEMHKPPGQPRPQFLRQLRDCFRQQRFDLVHSHNWGTLLETSIASVLAGGIVHVHSERGTVMGGSTARSALRRQINRWVFRGALTHCAAVLAVDDSVAGRVAKASGFRQERIRVIPNGVPCPDCPDRPKTRAENRAALGIGTDEFVVCTVGRLVPVKGYDLLVGAVARLREEGTRVHLILAGDGPLEQSLRDQALQSGIGDLVHLVGRTTRVGDWLATADLFVNSSLSEGMSQAIVEAMAFGLPLVVTNVGGNAWLVGGETPAGVVVPPQDVPALAAGINELVREPAIREQFRIAGVRRAETEFGLQPMIRQYEDLYERLTRASHGRNEGLEQGTLALGSGELP